MNGLENKIREVLPRLKELTKGCLLKKNDCLLEIVNDKKSLIYSVLEYSVFYHEKANKKDFEILGHPIKLNDVLEYIKLKSNFKELFYYYCSADPSENNESDDTFESNFRNYKTVFEDIYYDKEEGYHPDYDGDLLYKAIVRTSIFENEDGTYSHRFVIEPNDFILRNWDLSSVFLADQSDELKEFLNNL